MLVRQFLYIIKVKEYADQFKTAKQCKQTRATTCFSMCHRSTDADLDDECQEVSIIGVLITNTLQYVSYLFIAIDVAI